MRKLLLKGEPFKLYVQSSLKRSFEEEPSPPNKYTFSPSVSIEWQFLTDGLLVPWCVNRFHMMCHCQDPSLE